MQKKILLILLFPFLSFTQEIEYIEGEVNESKTKNKLYGVKVSTTEGKAARTDPDGKFAIKIESLPTWLYFSLADYKTDSILVEKKKKNIKIVLSPIAQEIKTLVVSASRRSQEIEDVPISMEVLKSDFIEKKGLVNLEQVADQSPGVYVMDGQVSIRGGGGYAYGVGSRVLVLTNGMPLTSPDLGDVKWNSIPLESMSQIEIIKGASSVLYGSGALNGMISLTPREPSRDGELKVKFQSGFYDNPKRGTLRWWDDDTTKFNFSSNPKINLLNIYYGKMFNEFGYTISSNGYFTKGYKDGEYENRVRLSGNLFYRPSKAKNIKMGVAFNSQFENVGRFIIWESATMAYTPTGGGSPDKNPNSSITQESSIRVCIDPYFKYLGKNNSKHELKGRYYLVSTGNPFDGLYSASKADMYYGDYQFSKKWNKIHNLTSGVTASSNIINSREDVFGDHTSINIAGYAQYDLNMERLDITAGVRLEYFKQDDRTPDSQFDIWETKNNIPIYPVFRAAIHYALAKNTHLRSSFGQGIRFPSVGERFLTTESGGVRIFPNPNIEPERGWATEIGIKQVFHIGKWISSFDIAGFVNQYDNMIEFAFDNVLDSTTPVSLVPGTPNYVENFFGFQAQNTEQARISGIEFSFNSQGKLRFVGIGEVELRTLIGYTYMKPVSLNTDPAYLSTFSDPGSDMLKYRFNHLAKADISITWKGLSVGYCTRYNSFMSNIDRLFEEGIQIPIINTSVDVLPGLEEYRENELKSNGSIVMDLRLGYKFMEKYNVNILVNNFLNNEYSSRPADIQPPRQFLVQLMYNI